MVSSLRGLGGRKPPFFISRMKPESEKGFEPAAAKRGARLDSHPQVSARVLDGSNAARANRPDAGGLSAPEFALHFLTLSCRRHPEPATEIIADDAFGAPPPLVAAMLRSVTRPLWRAKWRLTESW